MTSQSCFISEQGVVVYVHDNCSFKMVVLSGKHDDHLYEGDKVNPQGHRIHAYTRQKITKITNLGK